MAEHITADNGRDIQMAVHQIAAEWLRRGLCPDCVVRQILIGASCVAQDAQELASGGRARGHC